MTTACAHNGESWFDRSICSEPCGSTHTRCADCGSSMGACYFESEAYAAFLATEAEQERQRRETIITYYILRAGWLKSEPHARREARDLEAALRADPTQLLSYNGVLPKMFDAALRR